VGRLKPRLNPEVNGYWICDEGRYGYKSLDEGRLGRVLRLKVSPLSMASGSARSELGWEAAATEIASCIKRGANGSGAEGLAVVASGMLSNEDWAALKNFCGALGLKTVVFAPEPNQIGEQDDLLRRREKVPNLKGAENIGLHSASFDALAEGIESGRIWGLYVIERDLTQVWKEKAAFLLSRLSLLIYQGPNKNETSERAHYRLPATAYVEEEGHFTNFEGKVQPYKKALEPLGFAEPDWKILDRFKRAWVEQKPTPQEIGA
jgi:NADH-quinone oxidoreductase subunit G